MTTAHGGTMVDPKVKVEPKEEEQNEEEEEEEEDDVGPQTADCLRGSPLGDPYSFNWPIEDDDL